MSVPPSDEDRGRTPDRAATFLRESLRGAGLTVLFGLAIIAVAALIAVAATLVVR